MLVAGSGVFCGNSSRVAGHTRVHSARDFFKLQTPHNTGCRGVLGVRRRNPSRNKVRCSPLWEWLERKHMRQMKGNHKGQIGMNQIGQKINRLKHIMNEVIYWGSITIVCSFFFARGDDVRACCCHAWNGHATPRCICSSSCCDN